MSLEDEEFWNDDGICIVAYGTHAVEEAKALLDSLELAGIFLPVAMVTDDGRWVDGLNVYRKIIYAVDRDESGILNTARRAKLLLDKLSPFKRTLYIDADTRVYSKDILGGFDILADGWDLVIVPSKHQGNSVFAHIEEEERRYMREWLWQPDVIQLQAGVMFFDRNERIHKLFEEWRCQWLTKFAKHDQAALIRALMKSPVKVWLLGSPFNSRRGEVVDHMFGRAKYRI